MALDLTDKNYSPGQIQKSTWDPTANAMRTVVVDASGGGLSPLGNPVYFDYVGTPVTSAAYVEIMADSGADIITQLNIFDSSGQALYLSFGAAASEVDQLIIPPGGQGQTPVQIPANTRVSVKAVNTTANAGALIISLFG